MSDTLTLAAETRDQVGKGASRSLRREGRVPAEITISLKGLEVGDSIHISDVKLPKGATPAIDDRDFAIATIVPPTVPTAADEAADAEAQAEGSEEA